MSDGEGRNRDELRPRIGGRGGEVPQERLPRFRNRLLARVARLGAASGAASSRPWGTSSARDVRRPGPMARRCVVKARFVPMNAYGKRAAALHLTYIERDGVEQDGSAGRVYGPAEATAARVALSAPLEGEKRQWRFIISPEDTGGVDLTAFTRRLMAQVQADLRRPLVWGAVNHWNTDNPHVHVIVRGLDQVGRDVTIDGRYLSEGMRSRAQEILTNELGPRTELDVQSQLAREITQERFTSLDRALRDCEEPGGVLMETRLPRQGRVAGARLVARLGHLERLGLASRVSPVEWRLDEGWSETLRGLGQAKDVVKRMHAAARGVDPSRFIIVDESSPLPAVDGVVRAKGLHDELAGRPYAVIEGVDGRVFYAAIDLAAAERIAEGDVVRLAVDSRPGPGAGPSGPAATEQARPRVRVHRLGPPIAAQARYRGPTWLDAIADRRPASEGTGFAREITDALARRGAALKAMGVDALPPGRRVAALAAVEAKALGRRLAAERGMAFVESMVAAEGAVSLSQRLPSGRQYAIVSDADSKRLWVLPATRELRLLEGQRVQSQRTPQGRLVISVAGPGRRGPTRDR